MLKGIFKMLKTTKPEIPLAPLPELKDVVAYEWNGQVYRTKLEARKAKAKDEIHYLLSGHHTRQYGYNTDDFVNNYEKLIEILSAIKE